MRLSREEIAERDAQMREMWAAGKRNAEIAKALGMNPRTLRTRRSRLGVVGPPMDVEFVEREFLASGARSEEEVSRVARRIAQQVGRTVEHVRRHLRDAGLIESRKRISPEQYARAEAMLSEEGMPYSVVAKETGISAAWLAEKYPGRGLSPEDIPQWRAAKRLEEGLGL